MNDRWIDKPFSPRRVPFFYGWVIVAMAVLGTLASTPGQTIGISPFVETLRRELNLTAQQLSLAYMVGTFGSGLLMIRAGRFYDRHGVRLVLPLAALLLGVALVVFSRIDVIARWAAGAAGSGAAGAQAVGAEDAPSEAAAHSPLALWMTIAVAMAGFLTLRFLGQGVLTLVSRNAAMKWFVHYRGRVNSIMGLFVAFGFALSPLVLKGMIGSWGWRGALMALALVVGGAFPAVAWLFLRDNPEQCGLEPDGGLPERSPSRVRREPIRQSTLFQARRTAALWVFSASLSLFSLYITALAFHLESIFATAGWAEPSEGYRIFWKTTVISTLLTFAVGFLSDFVRLNRLLAAMLAAMAVSALGLLALEPGSPALWFVIVGNGVTAGIWNVLVAVAWPRFFGRTHLGEIGGFSMKWMVCMSAIGPWLFALSRSATHSYAPAAAGVAIAAGTLFIVAIKVGNPNIDDAEAA